jgi:hypothetical protein
MVRRVVVALSCLLGLGVFGAVTAASAQTMDGCYILGFEPGTGIPEYDCSYQKSAPHPPVFAGTWYSSIAKSVATYAWGASWHETTQAAADQSAVLSCAKSGQKDCKVVMTGANNCLSLAESSPDGIWGAAASDMDRQGAIVSATNTCRKYGGKNCSVVVTPCGRSSVTTPPCLQLPPANDISKGAVWASMTPEQKALWNKKPNGACK